QQGVGARGDAAPGAAARADTAARPAHTGPAVRDDPAGGGAGSAANSRAAHRPGGPRKCRGPGILPWEIWTAAVEAPHDFADSGALRAGISGAGLHLDPELLPAGGPAAREAEPAGAAVLLGASAGARDRAPVVGQPGQCG